MCDLFHWLCFHVAVADRCAGRCGADVVLPNCSHEEAAWGCCHHGAAIDDGVGVVRREVDCFDDCLGANVWGLLRVRERNGGSGVIGVFRVFRFGCICESWGRGRLVTGLRKIAVWFELSEWVWSV